MNRKIRTTRRRVSSGSSAQSTSIRLTSSPTKKENGESSPKQLTKMCKNPLVSEVCTRMYENKGKTGDVKFKIGTDEISAHKCVLASLSPKYEAQFYGEFDDTKSDVIEVKDVTADAFKEYLQFFYLNEFPLTHANIEHVLSLAELSLVEEFVDECINFLIETLSVETVCLTYCVAIKHGCEDVIELCERKISLHSDEVFASKDFVSSSREVIFNILQLDSLNCKETDVFNACIKWAKHVCTEKESDPDVKMNLRAALVPETPTQATNLLHQIFDSVLCQSRSSWNATNRIRIFSPKLNVRKYFI
ncbi:kelch-like protein 8 [Contarinia nasturtii]|uniref:kelch-like protein 8 n=1 Tax=Contarinia nasturtii TaxID=265458 RepID=UPI0012D425B7|nr:kelch-like protein 8 [Contarinia nasturtii]